MGFTKTRKGARPNISRHNIAAIKSTMTDILKQETLKTMSETVEYMSAITEVNLAIILSDKYGWTKEQILELVSRINTLNENILEKRTSTYDSIQVFRDELGFELPKILEEYMNDGTISEKESI